MNELYERFISAALEQHKAMLNDEHAKYNRLFEEIDKIEEELKRREGDQRHALIYLFDHPNAQVRLNAAIATLALEPEAARWALQLISDRDEYPQAPYARDMLSALDKGSYIPR